MQFSLDVLTLGINDLKDFVKTKIHRTEGQGIQ